MTVRIVGAFAGQLPERIEGNAAAHLLDFSAQVGQRFVDHDTTPVVYVGLGAEAYWSPEVGQRALSVLAGLRLDVADCDTTGLIRALCAVTDEDSARELVDTEMALHLQGATLPSTVGTSVAMAVLRAQHWTNAAASTLTPTAFVAEAQRVAKESELSFDVVQGDSLRDEGFGAIFSMGAGSPHPPALIDLRYRPAFPTATVTLVGKGVTFDTGGLSIKGAAAMAGMRQDKCGAATVLAVMSVLRDLEVDVEVRALLPVIENMVGPQSLRPGDEVTSWNGTRIQVMDTDFEGRVILADALGYACAEAPDLLIDIATLTNQVVMALGPEIGGLFSRDDETASRLLAAGRAAGEALWRLPYDERYLNQVVVPEGVKNHPETVSGRALTAALFLGQFVPMSTPWAHLDITGPAWRGSASSSGATGFGVRTLLWLLRSR